MAARGISVSAYVGRLVKAELKRRESRAVETINAEMPAAEQSIAALAATRAICAWGHWSTQCKCVRGA
jgi:hypothetical protein